MAFRVFSSYLLDDAPFHRRRSRFATIALEQRNTEFVFKLLHRHRQRRLRHERTFGSAAKVAFLVEVDEVAEFGEGHAGDYGIAVGCGITAKLAPDRDRKSTRLNSRH